jgi:hypothetical protein
LIVEPQPDSVSPEGNVSAEHELNQPSACYEITDQSGSKKWALSLFPDKFQLETLDGELHEVSRAQSRERVQTIEGGLFLPRMLVVTLGEKKVLFFKPSPEVFAAFVEWLGPPTLEDLKRSLKRRLRWVIPLGVLIVLSSLPIGNIVGDPVSLGLGVTLILTGTLARVWPHRILFALDSLWFSFLSANTIWLLIHEFRWLRLGVLLVQLALVRSGFREYRRFAPVETPAESGAASDAGSG